jgi:hypothetical protein
MKYISLIYFFSPDHIQEFPAITAADGKVFVPDFDMVMFYTVDFFDSNKVGFVYANKTF